MLRVTSDPVTREEAERISAAHSSPDLGAFSLLFEARHRLWQELREVVIRNERAGIHADYDAELRVLEAVCSVSQAARHVLAPRRKKECVDVYDGGLGSAY